MQTRPLPQTPQTAPVLYSLPQMPTSEPVPLRPLDPPPSIQLLRLSANAKQVAPTPPVTVNQQREVLLQPQHLNLMRGGMTTTTTTTTILPADSTSPADLEIQNESNPIPHIPKFRRIGELVKHLSESQTGEEVKTRWQAMYALIENDSSEEKKSVCSSLDSTAMTWLFDRLDDRSSAARALYSELDSFARMEGRETSTTLTSKKDFKRRCMYEFKGEKEGNNFNEFVLKWKEQAQELLLLGRHEYALIILKQLKACQLVDVKDKEVNFFIELIKGTKTRKDMPEATTDYWALEVGRTASLYTHALLVLLGPKHEKNLQVAVFYFTKAAKAGYLPAQQALDYLNERFEGKIIDKVEYGAGRSLAGDIAVYSGFYSGFCLDIKKIYKYE